MSTLNTYFLDPNGDPITGRLPATVVNLSVSRGVELTPAQHTALRHRYLAFCMRRKHEITQFAIEDGHLNDGTRYRITSAHGIDRILAWPMPFNPEDYCPNFLSGIAYKGWIAERTEGSENIQKMLSFYPALAGRPEDTTREWTDLDYFTLPPDVLIMPTREPRALARSAFSRSIRMRVTVIVSLLRMLSCRAVMICSVVRRSNSCANTRRTSGDFSFRPFSKIVCF